MYAGGVSLVATHVLESTEPFMACLRIVKVSLYAAVTCMPSLMCWRNLCISAAWYTNPPIAAAVFPCCTQDELYMNGAVVLPHKEIKEAVQQPNIIL
jgi:hypothetical protein